MKICHLYLNKAGGGWKTQTIWFSSNLYSNKGFSNCILSILRGSRKVLRANLKAEEVSPWVSHCQINYPSHIFIRVPMYNFIWEKKSSTLKKLIILLKFNLSLSSFQHSPNIGALLISLKPITKASNPAHNLDVWLT